SSGTDTPPSAWRKIARICGSVNLVVFIKISSFIKQRKFHFQTPLIKGGITKPPVAHAATPIMGPELINIASKENDDADFVQRGGRRNIGLQNESKRTKSRVL
ncbi:hypothetical protein, partial [Pseudochrobactrum saccharolyticum]|uniref:hypothetical protein n=1 Tax=Pseudochrobactrum saccharolyticum TaxID=354352 RepID=UPI002795BFEC